MFFHAPIYLSCVWLGAGIALQGLTTQVYIYPPLRDVLIVRLWAPSCKCWALTVDPSKACLHWALPRNSQEGPPFSEEAAKMFSPSPSPGGGGLVESSPPALVKVVWNLCTFFGTKIVLWAPHSAYSGGFGFQNDLKKLPRRIPWRGLRSHLA